MATLCQRRTAPAECKHPGDFAWRVCAERDVDGDCCAWRNPKEGERPTHLFLVEPSGSKALLAIRPEVQANGHSWEWDGDLERPTLQPSINAQVDGVGWHGYLRQGVLEDC